MSDLRYCETCGKLIENKRSSRRAEYAARRFCSRACIATSGKARRLSIAARQSSYEATRPRPVVKMPYLKFLDPKEWKTP